jgi:hypothetical protein
MSIVCPVCGTTNADGTEYCEGCGIALSSVGAADASPVSLDAAPTQADFEPSPSVADGVSGAPSAHPLTSDEAPAAEGVPTGSVSSSSPPSYANPASTSMPTTGTHLVHKSLGALTSTTILLRGPRLTVGRFDPSSGPVDIDLSGFAGQENISRRHAEIYQEQGAWCVRDLGSTNGVFVKPAGAERFEPRLQAPAVLGDGDEIAFGNITFVFHAGP